MLKYFDNENFYLRNILYLLSIYIFTKTEIILIIAKHLSIILYTNQTHNYSVLDNVNFFFRRKWKSDQWNQKILIFLTLLEPKLFTKNNPQQNTKFKFKIFSFRYHFKSDFMKHEIYCAILHHCGSAFSIKPFNKAITSTFANYNFGN